MGMTKDQIRERMMNFGKQVVDFNGKLPPGLEDLEGELAIRELSAADTSDVNDIATVNGKYSSALDIGVSVARGLVTRSVPHERIYSDLDAQTLSELGFSMLKPIAMQIKKLSGLTEDSLASAKKNSPQKPQADSTPDSDTSSTETVALPVLG
jgi:hypothetical protein